MSTAKQTGEKIEIGNQFAEQLQIVKNDWLNSFRNARSRATAQKSYAILILRYGCSWKHAEIAAAFKLTVGHVERLIRKAVRSIREFLQPSEPDRARDPATISD